MARRNAKLVDKGLKPPKSSTPKNFVDTNPKTHYTSKIGAFLNNKKKGDLKGTTKHTITKIDHNNEEYDAYDLVLDYIMESKQASSIEEANYIMMEMDQNTIYNIVKENTINRADILGGTPAARNAQRGIGKYTPGVGVTKDFQLDPNFKIKA